MTTAIDRRQVLAGLAIGTVLVSETALAQGPVKGPPKGKEKDPHAGHAMPAKDAPPKAPPSPKLAAVVAATAECQAAGRACLAACTDHLAMGMPTMAECQRAVMNMLTVSAAMADVAGFNNAAAANMKALAAACAAFCRTCEKACEAHAAHHVECKACMEACRTCASACEAL